MDTMEDPVFLIPCGHTFGEDCIVRLLMDRPYMFSCPFGCTIDVSLASVSQHSCIQASGLTPPLYPHRVRGSTPPRTTSST
jgi:hypothetical protein